MMLVPHFFTGCGAVSPSLSDDFVVSVDAWHLLNTHSDYKNGEESERWTKGREAGRKAEGKVGGEGGRKEWRGKGRKNEGIEGQREGRLEGRRKERRKEGRKGGRDIGDESTQLLTKLA